MISSLNRFESLSSSSVSELNDEVDFLRNTLEVLRITEEITNDAFLEAGSIQGGLSLLINLLTQGISDEEANIQLFNLKKRASSLTETYPGLDNSIEKFCKNEKVSCFRGNLTNVTKRYSNLIREYNLKSFVRICADSPLIDPKIMDKAIELFKNKNDYYLIIKIKFD